MDLQKKYLILGLILFAFCELSTTMGLCRFARMFPNQGKMQCFKDNTSKEDRVVTCESDDLPKVQNGSFDCPGNTNVSLGDFCNLTCHVGFYPTSTNQAACEIGGGQKGHWSKANFECQGVPVSCNTNYLPYVSNGSFRCPPDSKVSLGDACNLTCEDGFYPASSDQAVCEAGMVGGHKGNWSQGSFACNDWSDVLDERIYRFVLDKMSFSNATENCQSLNSSLVFIEWEEEDNFVHQLVLRFAPDKGPWSGSTWIRNNVSGSEYDNWDTGQPDGIHPKWGKEECLAIKYDSGKWHDYSCNRTLYSVCEQNI